MREPRRRKVALLWWLISIASCTFAPTATALDDPDLDFHTIETPNFFVHYHSGTRDFAWRVARVHEEAHLMLEPLLEWTPRSKTHVVVTGRSDTANGSANVYGRNLIRIYTMPPPPEGVLGYYDDWLRILAYHEYVHILHLDTATGPVAALNRLVGKQWNPNQVLPRWYIEGIAVLHESKRTGTGRLESSLFRMWLRTAALEDRFVDLGAATGSPLAWPMGSVPYLYGGFFMQYVTDTYGDDVIPTFNADYGRRPAPFGLNRSAREATGETFHALWREWTAVEKARAEATRVAVQATGRTSLDYLTDAGGEQRAPSLRHGHLGVTYASRPLVAPPSISSTSTGRVVHAQDGLGSAHTWTPDGETVYFARRTIDRQVYAYDELFAHHPASERTWQVTRGERAREPALSPDGQRLVYVRSLQGSSELVMRRVDPDGPAPQVLLGARDFPGDDERHWQQISNPVFSPSGDEIAFSWWRLDRRQRDLWLLRLDAPAPARLVQLTNDVAQDLAPSFGPDGRLYFSSDRTGVYNIYAIDLDSRRTWQLSNVVNGVFDPVVSPDGRWIYVTSYTSSGYEIARFEHPVAPPEVRAPKAPRALRSYPHVDEASWDEGPYHALRWLAPLTLTPSFATSAAGGGLGASVQGSDPIGHHRYAASLVWVPSQSVLDRRLSAALNYDFGGWPVDVGATLRYRESPRARSLIAESRFIPFTEREIAGGYRLRLPIRRISDTLQLTHSATLAWNDFAKEPEISPRPDDITPQLPSFGYSADLGLGVSYSNLDYYPHSISPTDGISAGLGLNLSEDFSEADLSSTFLSYSFGAYASSPWLPNHVGVFRVDGGLLHTQKGAAGRFGLGGFGPQDVLTDLILQRPRAAFVLHGFPPGAFRGSHYQVWRLQYRFPILDLDHGLSTLPVFFRRVKGRVFAEAGSAFDGPITAARFHPSAGAEVQLESIFGYFLGGALTAGYARGFDPSGVHEWWIRYGVGY